MTAVTAFSIHCQIYMNGEEGSHWGVGKAGVKGV